MAVVHLLRVRCRALCLPPIVDRIGQIAPCSVLLIYTDPGLGGENTRQPKYSAAAREPKTIWKVPGSKHTGGIAARPKEYERRVIAFFDRVAQRHWTFLKRGSRREKTGARNCDLLPSRRVHALVRERS
jgi:hypothetical protein